MTNITSRQFKDRELAESCAERHNSRVQYRITAYGEVVYLVEWTE